MSRKYIKSVKVRRKSVIPMVLELTDFFKTSHKTACIYKKSKNLIKNQKIVPSKGRKKSLWRVFILEDIRVRRRKERRRSKTITEISKSRKRKRVMKTTRKRGEN